MSTTRVWAPIAVVALGDPSRGDEGLPLRLLGRVRTLIGEIGCSRIAARSVLDDIEEPVGPGGSQEEPQSSLALVTGGDLGPLVQWIEGGTETVRLEPFLEDRRRVVLIDTMRFGGKPGTVYHWHLENTPVGDLSLLRHFGKVGKMKLDHLAFWLEDDLPVSGIDMIGIEPSDSTEGDRISRPMQRRLASISSQVTALIFRVLVEEGW